MSDLTEESCQPCEGGVEPMTEAEAREQLQQVENWDLLAQDEILKLEKTYKLNDFVAALEFVNEVGEIAGAEGHHPDILISYNRVTLTLWTHAIDGLSRNDFILAAKCDGIEF